MGSTSVNDVGSLFASLSIGTQSLMASKISTETKSDSASFESYLMAGKDASLDIANVSKTETKMADKNPANGGKDTSDRIAGEDKADAGMTSAADKKQVADKTDSSEKSVSNDKPKGTGLAEKSKVMSDEEVTEAMAVLETVAADFLLQISEILNITPEEAKDILADLQLTETDLLNPENLSAFALRAMGAEDSLSLLTNETQFEQFQNISAELKEVLGTESGFEEFNVKELRDLMAMQDVTEGDEVAVKQEVLPETVISKVIENKKEEVKSSASSVIKDDLAQVTTEEGTTLGTEALVKANARGNENGRDGRHGDSHMNPGHLVFQNPLQNNLNNILTDAPFSSVFQQETTAGTQDIANQILDYMRSSVKPDMQTLEMQLHPASLGNIQISLVHKDGNISANFVASDEQVKAVLENQMIQLKERFEEQGIKVNTIEVSVGTQLSQQDLNRHGNEGDPQQQEQKRVRRLTLGPDLLPEDMEDLDEEDRITAEMMAANGQTMDARV
jgi:flagellar hook-length control protein FliK